MDVYQALSDPVRRDLLRQLLEGPQRVVDLTAGRGISRPAVSRHLRLLSQAGLVRVEDQGRERHYRLDAGPLAAVKTLITELEAHFVSSLASPSALDALGTEVRRVGHDRRRLATPTTSTAGHRMNATPTGQHQIREGRAVLVLTRTFRAPIADVWAAVTEPNRMARWIGTWTGDPTSGSVQFAMNAEGDGAPEQTFSILSCEPPRSLTVHSADDSGGWELGFTLDEQDGITTFEFTQVIHDPNILDSVGPGWDYYLDRLMAAQSGDDPSAINFDRDYYPALSEHYAALLPTSE